MSCRLLLLFGVRLLLLLQLLELGLARLAHMGAARLALARVGADRHARDLHVGLVMHLLRVRGQLGLDVLALALVRGEALRELVQHAMDLPAEQHRHLAVLARPVVADLVGLPPVLLLLRLEDLEGIPALGAHVLEGVVLARREADEVVISMPARRSRGRAGAMHGHPRPQDSHEAQAGRCGVLRGSTPNGRGGRRIAPALVREQTRLLLAGCHCRGVSSQGHGRAQSQTAALSQMA
mmetsp:Transcript_56309/g.158713  ORF Transcript_56309/g.158713 Transcript_56309/m.158713 type:complete len:237 (-) Transcript_56309:740-1450(-)